MENNYEKNSIYKNAMNYGLILGLAIVIYIMVLEFIGMSVFQNQLAGWAVYAFMAVAIIIGNKNLRDNFQGGFISFGRSLGSAMLISVVGGFIYGFFVYVLLAVISPETINEMILFIEDEMLSKGVPEEQLEIASKFWKAFMTPAIMSISSFFNTAFLGLVIGLVVSAFVKKEQNIFDQQ
jgi:tetrahydromethanopterin S-methyltransferase subunit B